MNLTLGYFVPEFPSQTHAFFWREVNALREQGISVQLFSSRRPPDTACYHPFADTARQQTYYVFPPNIIKVLSFAFSHPHKLWWGISYIVNLPEISYLQRVKLMSLLACAIELVAHCRNLDINHVHFHSCANSAHIGAIANIISEISYSLTLHGDLTIYGTHHPQKMMRAELVTAVTTPLKKQILDATSMTEDRVPIIHMGVDVDYFQPKTRQKDTSTELHVVTVARLNRVKGHVYMLEALSKLQEEGHNIKYSIAGEGTYRPEIEKRIKELKLVDSVVMLGSIGEDDVLRLLQSADIFALTSTGRGEAAPVSVMEAMACGLPTICSIIGGTPDMIEHRKDGFLLNQKDIPAITNTLRELILSPELRYQIGKAARQKAVHRYDYRVTAKQLSEAILKFK
ncbi:Glycosyltransferase type 1 [Halomicronema hongdechloris C2206]|uniref:Glycosyltransferase type 1 n=1 Tax=Halomicronema hongdechloris C2206 TaxID=1641165 RepID=A0A1Z3HN54_9CYAN|nr:glycosyltransferase family 4 protein [Halomicronema hongdechloris]ASC71577.1 Glycosyltransferase type 1 [Halomicronema hongdechloris C2206]